MHALAVELHALRNRAHRVHIQAGIGLVQYGQLRFQHQHLENFGLFLFAAGETDVEVALGVGFIHVQQPHGFRQLLFEVPKAQAAAGFLLQCGADEGAQRHARHLQRVLKGEENPLPGALVDGQVRDVLAVEHDAALRHLIGGVAGHGIAQRRLAGAVRPHQHMGFIFTNTQIHAVENFLLLHANVKIIDLQKLFFHVVPSSFPRILAEEFLPFR